ncbi:hypothetical protein F4677DRAFT_72022 [Hypoxylon crocopeplum]|nr:hypothetical protein F4677DRAFT_72022 [Hypoxylon crocopeplum]
MPSAFPIWKYYVAFYWLKGWVLVCASVPLVVLHYDWTLSAARCRPRIFLQNSILQRTVVVIHYQATIANTLLSHAVAMGQNPRASKLVVICICIFLLLL